MVWGGIRSLSFCPEGRPPSGGSERAAGTWPAKPKGLLGVTCLLEPGSRQQIARVWAAHFQIPSTVRLNGLLIDAPPGWTGSCHRDRRSVETPLSGGPGGKCDHVTGIFVSGTLWAILHVARHLAAGLERGFESGSTALNGSGFEKTFQVQLPLTHLKSDATRRNSGLPPGHNSFPSLVALVSLSGHPWKGALKMKDAFEGLYLAQEPFTGKYAVLRGRSQPVLGRSQSGPPVTRS